MKSSSRKKASIISMFGLAGALAGCATTAGKPSVVAAPVTHTVESDIIKGECADASFTEGLDENGAPAVAMKVGDEVTAFSATGSIKTAFREEGVLTEVDGKPNEHPFGICGFKAFHISQVFDANNKPLPGPEPKAIGMSLTCANENKNLTVLTSPDGVSIIPGMGMVAYDDDKGQTNAWRVGPGVKCAMGLPVSPKAP